MSNDPRSDTVSDKMVVVDPQLTRAYTDASSTTTTTTTTTVMTKAKKKAAMMLKAYTKNVEGLQMVQ